MDSQQIGSFSFLRNMNAASYGVFHGAVLWFEYADRQLAHNLGPERASLVCPWSRENSMD